MITSDSSKQRLLAIAAIVVMALLIVNAFLLYNKYNQSQVIEAQKSEIIESDKLKIEMEKQYHEALAELEEMRNNNEELNAIIDQQKIELKSQREKINQLLQAGGNLDRARLEIKNLGIQVSEYMARIEQLNAENENLKGENEKLVAKTEKLVENLESERNRAQELTGEKEQLETVKTQLSRENEKLTDKVTLASVIRVKDISVVGMKQRDSGKMVKKKYAKNVDQLRICFSTEANEIANPGLEKFFVRIINPIGETMAIDDLGSGVLFNKSSGEEIRYTSLTEYDYSNDATEICYDWNPSSGNFQNGKYQVEVYNKGHLSGTSTFELK